MSKYSTSPDSKTEKIISKLLLFLGAALVALCLILTYTAANAQAENRPVRSLKPGDSLPELFIGNLIQHSSPTVNLKAEPDKLLVLVFFGTWCSSCRAALNNYQVMQNLFADKLRLFLVSAESRAKLEGFFAKARNEAGAPYTLPCVTEDTVLNRLFEHRLIPHLVWIKEGKVEAVTSSDYLSEEYIKSMLQGSFSAQQKLDLDADKPLFMTGDMPFSGSYSVFFKGQIDGLGSGGVLRQENDKVSGRMISNTSLFEMYSTVGRNLIKGYNARRMLVELKEPGLFNPDSPDLKWRRENYCTYEIRIEPGKADSLFHYMLDDLNRYSPYTAGIEKRKVQAYALKIRKGQLEKAKSKGGKKVNSLFFSDSPRFSGYSAQILTNRLNELTFLQYPILDETSYQEGLEVSFSKTPETLEELQSALAHAGLELVPVKRQLELLVIRDDH